MLEAEDSATAHAATQLLAAAAGFMQLFMDKAEGRADAVKAVTRLLTRSMETGPYKTTKAAVRQILVFSWAAGLLCVKQCRKIKAEMQMS